MWQTRSGRHTEGGGPLGKRGERMPGHSHRSKGEGREAKKEKRKMRRLLGRGRTGSSEVSSQSFTKPPPTVRAVLWWWFYCSDMQLQEGVRRLHITSSDVYVLMGVSSSGWCRKVHQRGLGPSMVFFFQLFIFNLILHLQYLTPSPFLHNSSSLALWESLIALTSSLELSHTFKYAGQHPFTADCTL